MFPNTILFHLTMLAVDAFALRFISRHKEYRQLLTVSAVWCCMMMLFALLYGENGFGNMRLTAYGVFLHAAPMALFTGVLLRSGFRWLAIILVTLSFTLACVGIYSFFVEPRLLEVNHYEISHQRINVPMQIAIVSDLQTDFFGEYEQNALATVLALKPDVMLMTGDYLQIMPLKAAEDQAGKMNDYLRQIRFNAPLGIIAVNGDVDGPGWPQLFSKLPIRPINISARLAIGDIQATALSRNDSRRIDLQIERTNDKFHIVFGHSPNFARGKIDADLLVAGHTHGGQIRLPGLGPLYIHSKVPRRWGAGITDLGSKKLIVSRGIGMERGYAPRLRFLCRPEIVVIHLVPLAPK